MKYSGLCTIILIILLWDKMINLIMLCSLIWELTTFSHRKGDYTVTWLKLTISTVNFCHGLKYQFTDQILLILDLIVVINNFYRLNPKMIEIWFISSHSIFRQMEKSRIQYFKPESITIQLDRVPIVSITDGILSCLRRANVP